MRAQCDINNDGQTGLEEAIYALQIVAGIQTNKCSDNSDCIITDYCSKPDEECSVEGVCERRPTGCPLLWDPICGCDERTYGNNCEAAAAGVSVSSFGECKQPCTSTNECESVVYCEERPTVCPDVWAPVCGCDGATYENQCEAKFAGVAIYTEGVCQ